MFQWKNNQYYTAWVCVFLALGIQHAMGMSHIVICGVPRSKIFFHIISHTAGFSQKKLLITKYVFWFSLQRSSETFLILRRNERDMIKSVYCSSCKVPFVLVRFWWNLNFLNRFSKTPPISNFRKIRPMGAELFHADGRTDEQIWRGLLSLFAILQTRLKSHSLDGEIRTQSESWELSKWEANNTKFKNKISLTV